MSVELQEDLRNITQVLYCDLGEDKLQQIIDTIEYYHSGKELKQIMKVIKKEKKMIDKRFKEYYEQYVDYRVIE